jgi:amino acid adenylation domain-containing protein
LHANLAEIFDCYFALLNDEPPPDDAPLALSFRDYVQLERKALESEEARQYWDRQLADCTILELPRWSSNGAGDGGQRVRRLSVPVSPDVSDGLKQAARSLAVPIKSVLLAVHLKVLSLLSGQTDVMTGLVSNGRPEERDGEQIRGLFLNTLPFRVKIAPGTWADLVRGTFKAELEMLPFRRYPLMALQNQHGRTSLFDVMFNYTYFHVIDSLLESRRVEVLDNAFMSEETNFKLTPHFFLTPILASVALDLDYDSTWFGDDQIKAIAGYYSAALEQVAAHPLARHDVSCLLSDAERRQLLFGWNDTRTDCSQYKCVHEMFESQVEQTPDAIAVVFADEQLSYRELNRRANQLAHYLIEKGAEPDALIGLCLDRSLDMAIAVLAVLKTGAAYVPLDPAYPGERLSYMLGDARPRVLVTQSWLRELLSGQGAQVICLDTEWPEVASRGDGNPTAGVDADNLTYVIYTSGSTGNPKGIALPHRCLSNLIEWHFKIHSRASKTLQFASLSFDASFHEMFSAWCSGGTLFMISNALRMDLAALARFLHDEGIEKVTLPVVVLQQFSEEYADRPEVFSGLREIITTGEQLQISRPVINLFRSLKNTSLHNHYGPSETHVVTWLSLPDEPDSWETFPPIGRPIDSTQMYVLDQSFNPVPIGVPGELYIGGVSLARGYLNQPGLTAEKFIPNPFATEAGARLYRTGDLARYRTDGDIDFLGRIDHQVKIRGFRVELGEIESVLGRHPSVLEVVVLAREDVPGEKSLAAYIVSDEQQAVGSSELRDYLMGKLPDYMVPSAFVIMKSLPLTANGKIDRRALPAPDHTRPELKKEFVAPRSAAEQVVSKIMAKALGVEQVGVFDNFFELGGHSLMATRVLFRLREAFRVDLPLPSLFERPTVEGVVDALAQIWGDREIVEQIAQTILEIEQLSEEELNLMLAEQSNDEQAGQ